MDPEELARAYVRLGLRLDRILPGVLDVHLGDPADVARVAGEPTLDPAALAREADRLGAAVPGSGLATDRAAFLDGQLRACRVLADRAGGRAVGFVDEVEGCYGVRISPGDPDRYREAHRALDALLGGRGPLPERLAGFRARDRVPAARLAVAVRTSLAALRARTATVLGLPPGEEVVLDVVESAAWSGFSRRLGPRRSAVSVNAGAGHRWTHLPLLVAHEAYPGHHTEHCRAEWRRDTPGGAPPEREVFLARTPQSLVAEGAAELGLEVVVGPGWGVWNAEVLAEVGIELDPERAAIGEALETVMAGLAEVRQDAALMLHAQDRSADDVAAHLRRWLLVDETRARRMLEFLAHPRWRTHTTTYVEGVRLLRPWLFGADAPEPATARFARLLDDAPAPSLLRAIPVRGVPSGVQSDGTFHSGRPHGRRAAAPNGRHCPVR